MSYFKQIILGLKFQTVCHLFILFRKMGTASVEGKELFVCWKLECYWLAYLLLRITTLPQYNYHSHSNQVKSSLTTQSDVSCQKIN